MQWWKTQNHHQDYWQRALVCFHTLGYLYRPGETPHLQPVYMSVICPSARSNVQGLESFPGKRPLFVSWFFHPWLHDLTQSMLSAPIISLQSKIVEFKMVKDSSVSDW